MVILQYLMITWLLIPISVRSVDPGQRINATAILTEYILVCGFDHLCYPSTLPLLPKPSGYDHIIKCPSCSCNQDCFHYNTCCPDMVLRYPEMSCVDVSLSNTTQGDTVLMVTSCPPGTEDDRACVTENYDNANTITEVPVSSSKETVVFKNSGCAACHGQKNNLTKWNFKMECERIVDINHMSSYGEIFQAGLDNMCNMSYQSSRLFDHFKCSPEHSSPGLKQCNMTGQWEEYNSHIEWACRNFQKPYRGFENVFCFACNPGKRSGDDRLIAGCNKTGMWNPYDLELEKACLYYPTLQIAYPYKNRYCYLCNRRNNMSDIFMDAKTSIELEKWETLDNSYELILGIQSFRHQYIYQADIHSVLLNSTATLSDDHYSTYKNVSKLLFLYFLHYGNNGHCPEEGDDTNEAHQQCTCSLSCVTSSRCCAEFALSGPVVNANEFKNSLSVSKCCRNYEFSNSTLQEKCETTQLSKGIFQIPVRSRYSDILYRNVYCLLCNEVQETTNGPDTKPEYDPLDLHIRCNVTFLTERYIFLENLLKEFDQMEGQGQYCTFSTVYDRYDDKKPVPSTIDKCNVTGEWDIYDSDIEWACLNYNHDITSDHYSEIYRNIFCEMCNKALDTDLEYTSCETNSTIADDCERFPQVTSMKPYKNIFCMICNYISPSTKLANAGVVVDVSDIRPGGCHDRRTDGDGDGGISLITATVRDLFSISMAPEFLGEVDHVIDTYGNHCLENEIYDMEKSSCIVQDCADGKMLTDGKCIPLLQLTTSLGYTLALRIKGSVLALEDIIMETLLYDLQSIVYNFIAFELNGIPSVLSSYVSVPIWCRQQIHLGDRINVTMTFYTSFYILDIVNRFDVESKLINITSSTISHVTDRAEVDLAVEIHPSALYLPGNVVLLDFEANCFRVEQSNFKYDSHAYRLKFVSKLLLCPRVRIQKERYEIDTGSRSMKLLPNGPVLAFGNYELSVNTTAIICVEDFTDMVEGRTSVTDEEDLLSSVLSIVSFLCTCLSMLCLIITFLTYCFFAELRTIPGKNNMCLIVSLFFSQCLMQFGMKQTQHTHLCMIIAIFLHFFWLSTFFSMNVCSFHMYRVFVFPLTGAKRVHRWTCFWYACYIFGMSALIVTVYIALSVTVFDSDNLGYTGTGNCFLTSFESVIATFISPVMLVCLSNVIFFVVVAYKIATAPNVPSTRNVRKEYPLYVKLFVLTGATWLLQIIDAFIPLSVFSIISGIMNSSQGIFIFLSYSTNSRVRKFYKDRLSSTRTSDKSQRKRGFVEMPNSADCDDDNHQDSRI